MNARSLPVLRRQQSISSKTLLSKKKHNLVQKLLKSSGKNQPDYTASQTGCLLFLFTAVKISGLNFISSLILGLDLWGS
jgi:hypothetical protein